MLKILGGIVGVLVIAVVVLNFTLPDSFTVEREIVINKPVGMVFNELKFLKKHKAWDPWVKKDPNLKSDFKGDDGTVGFIASWSGNEEVGVGEQEITNIVEGAKIETELRFKEPFENKGVATFSTNPVSENETKVTWVMTGDSKFPMNIMCLFMSMDDMLGKEFEAGLSSMKQHFESM